MTVPDEAVEAAAGAYFENRGDCTYRDAFRLALEAAAPFIAAQAWDECAEGYCEQLSNKVLDWEELANPYRRPDDQ